MRYITDQQAAKIPALADLDPAGQALVLADAARVYTRVRRDEWITRDDLATYGEQNDLPPDRLNAALELLTQTGRLLAVTDHPGQTTDAIVTAPA